MSLESEYRVLHVLKKIDEKMGRLNRERDKIPLDVGKLEERLNHDKQLFDDAKTQFETHQKELRDLERELKAKEEELRKAEEKMMEVKSNEAYQAAMKENEIFKQTKSKLEDKVLTLMNDLEGEKSKFTAAEQEYKKCEKEVKDQKDSLKKDDEKLQQLLSEQGEKKESAVVQLEGKTANLYKRLQTRMNGQTIVLVENGLCEGCRVKIRPQLFNEVLGFSRIHQCPSCNRIIICRLPEDNDEAKSSSG